jgi:hypothetical protein
MTKRLRIFISSPGDVAEERLRANLVVQKLARDYARFFKIEPYLWEYEPMLASGHFQDAIEPPSASDIVVLIVYARLGTALPQSTGMREYRGLDGRTPVTGTEWEFEEALASHRARGAPDLLAYRKLGDPGASLLDPAKRAEQERQWNALEHFWQMHFEGSGLFLAGSAKFHTLDEFDQKLESDLAHLIERRIAQADQQGAGTAEESWFKGSPFRGLAAYDFDDAPVFFGRDAQIREALTRLQAAAQQGTAFLLVLGASGSGKSSLARAGLLPALFAPKAVPGVGIWRRAIMRPGEGDEDPVLGLARALASGPVSQGIGLPELLGAGASVEEFAAHLAAAADSPSFPLRAALERVANEARLAQGLLPHEMARLVLLVDQLEELFTRRIDASRRDLFLRLLAGLASSGLVWVVATMRNDLWHRAAEAPRLVELVEKGARLDLLRPDGAQIIEIIRRPAAAAGLVFEADPEHGIGLDAVIAQAAAEEPGVLPLLSVMLEELYERDIGEAGADVAPRRSLRFSTYRGLGELKGAIAKRADQALHALTSTDPEAGAAFPRVLRALVTTSARGDAVTSRPARLDSFPQGGPEARLVAALLAPGARLLVASQQEGGAELRLAHEALIDNWPMAREQIKLDRRDLETRSRLEAMLRRWSEATTSEEQRRTLLSGLNLAEGSDLVRRWGMDRSSGLGAFVQASERADTWRRRRSLIAASVLLFIFAGIAGIAGLQWLRAESEAETARKAQRTEMEARANAEAQRRLAEQSEAQAVSALRESKLQTMRGQIVLAKLATDQKDEGLALTRAVAAAKSEQELLKPGEIPESEPALLGALADAREVVHIQGSVQTWWVPYGFLGDSTLVYAEPQGGIVLVDLRHEAKITARVPFPVRRPATQLVVLPDRRLVAVASIEELFIVDMQAQKVISTIPFAERIAALDIAPRTHLAVVATGASIAIVDLDKPGMPELISVPDARADVKVGQARFAEDETKILVSYGVKLFSLDLAARSFSGPIGELPGTGLGIDSPTLQSIIADGNVPFVRLFPDAGKSPLYFTYGPLDLEASRGDGTVHSLQRDDKDMAFVGMGWSDIDRKSGAPRESVAVLAKSQGERLTFELRYMASDTGLANGNDKLLPPFASFAIATKEFANQKPDNCKLSLEASFLVCQYWSKDLQGMVAWRLGGAHPFARIAARPGARSGVVSGTDPAKLLISSPEGLVSLADGMGTKLADLAPDWRLTVADGPFLAAMSPSARQGRVFRLEQGRVQAIPVLGPLPADDILLSAAAGRALVRTQDRLVMTDLTTGNPLWTAPLGELRLAALSSDAASVLAVGGDAVYRLDAQTGRILGSSPAKIGKDVPLAIDPLGQSLAFLDGEQHAMVLDIGSGAASPIGDEGQSISKFAWSRDSRLLLIGHGDGSVSAFEIGKGRRWSIASPLEGSVKSSALPNQPPQGTVLQIALSRDGGRLAVIRQDMRQIDIYGLADGRSLTALTPPSSIAPIPVAVSFEADEAIVSAWALHVLTRQTPIYVTVHRLPKDLKEALSAAELRLAVLTNLWSPSGPAQTASGQ